jgi:hypothetical protein
VFPWVSAGDADKQNAKARLVEPHIDTIAPNEQKVNLSTEYGLISGGIYFFRVL